MQKIYFHLDKSEYFNNVTSEFIYLDEIDITMEHSLYTISNWESIWHKPFLKKENKTKQELFSYIQCMIVYPENINMLYVYKLFNDKEMYNKIIDFINNEATATTFNNIESNYSSNQFISSELIYSWMSSLNIPYEPTEHWHINHLLTLIKVINENNKPKKKKTMNETLNDYSKLNEMRRKKYNTKG